MPTLYRDVQLDRKRTIKNNELCVYCKNANILTRNTSPSVVFLVLIRIFLSTYQHGTGQVYSLLRPKVPKFSRHYLSHHAFMMKIVRKNYVERLFMVFATCGFQFNSFIAATDHSSKNLVTTSIKNESSEPVQTDASIRYNSQSSHPSESTTIVSIPPHLRLTSKYPVMFMTLVQNSFILRRCLPGFKTRESRMAHDPHP